MSSALLDVLEGEGAWVWICMTLLPEGQFALLVQIAGTLTGVNVHVVLTGSPVHERLT